jgi:toxin ParE1/3/4
MKIVITNFAKLQLQSIYEYISKLASPNIAINEIDRINLHISLLERTPKAGRIVEELKTLSLHHRQLVVSNYKIIYRIEESIIYITDVFDCRQHPNKIIRRNK